MLFDHHYLEHTFVLATVWLGLRWFRRLDDWRSAAALGAVFGLALLGFHTGLFVLQIVLLACAFLLWLRGETLQRRSAAAFSAALLVALQLVLWPSATFRAGLLRVRPAVLVPPLRERLHRAVHDLHEPVAVLGAARSHLRRASLGDARTARSTTTRRRNFAAGRFSILSEIGEASSVYALATRTVGLAITLSYYSWLIALAPFALALHAYLVVTERKPERLFYSIAVVAGLAMLLAQFRFQYYGFFALVTAPLVALERLRDRFAWHRGATIATALLAVAAAYQPPLRHRLFEMYAPAAEPAYTAALPLFLGLAEHCAAEPGVALAKNDDGNAILFHTRCSVIANNFILRAPDIEHLARESTRS